MQDQQNNFIVRERAHIGDYSCNIFSSHNARKSFYCSLAGLAVFLLSFVIVPYIVVEAGLGGGAFATQQVSVGAVWNTVSLELDPDYAATQAGGAVSDTGHGDVLFGDIHPTSVADGNIGTQVVVKKTINVTTPGKFYTVYLSTTNETNSLQHTFSNTESVIPAITNTTDTSTGETTASAFVDSAWGYSLESNIPTTSLGQELTKLNDATIYNQDTWLAVPVLAQAREIHTNTTTESTGFAEGDSFDIYYSIMLDTDVLAGTYENQILYTALASSDALDEVSKNITRSTYYAANGAEQTLSFDLSMSVGGGDSASSLVTAEDITVYLVPHSTVVASKDAEGNYTVSQTMLDTAALSPEAGGYQTCSLTDGGLSLTNTGAIVICNMPDETPLGDNDGEGYYDFWVHIEPYGYNYISRYTDPNSIETDNTTASVLYAGLQSRTSDNDHDGENDLLFTTMQEMHPNVCRNTNMWNNQTGENARIFDYKGMSSGTRLVADITKTVINEETQEEETVVDGEATAQASAEMNIGTFSLKDNRDDKPYLVRRLADGNCWMVQELDLDLSLAVNGSIILTATNTDLNQKDTWLPNTDTVTKTFKNATTPRYRRLNNNSYYNWYAATANSGTPEMENAQAQDSICPYGWRLPTWQTTKSWYDLLINHYAEDAVISGDSSSAASGNLQNSTERLMQLPVSLALNGYVTWVDDSAVNQNYSGNAWSASAYYAGDSPRAWHLSLSLADHVVFPRYNSGRGSGLGVRCVAK